MQVLIDAGAGITKICLKHCNLKNPDSIRNLTVIGILSGVKDTYDNFQRAFKDLLEQINVANRKGFFVCDIVFVQAK